MRRGVGVLAPVLGFAVFAGIIVLVVHSLWRNSSRTLFSVQEQRRLATLARSAIEEAVFEVQSELDRSDAEREGWVHSAQIPNDLSIVAAETRSNAWRLSLNLTDLRYEVRDVRVTRIRAPGPPTRGTPRAPGIVDFEATVEVARTSPRHAATLVLGDRRIVRVAGDLGPFPSAGKHLEILADSAGRWTISK